MLYLHLCNKLTDLHLSGENVMQEIRAVDLYLFCFFSGLQVKESLNLESLNVLHFISWPLHPSHELLEFLLETAPA